MSLNQKLTALVQAIGADIKQLKSTSGESKETPDSVYRLYPDSDYVCRVIETLYDTGEVKSRSWLGGLVNGQYTTLIEAFFDRDGYSLLRLNRFDILYYPGTSVVMSQRVNVTLSINNVPKFQLFNDLIRIKSQTPDEVWTNFTQWEDKSVFNGTSSEMGTVTTPFSTGIQYAEFFFDASNTKHAVIGIALGSFDLQTGAIGDTNFDSIGFDTSTGNLLYGGGTLSVGSPMSVTSCTYGFRIEVATKTFTVYHIAGSTITTVGTVVLPMVLEGGYFVFTGKDPYTRTKFRCNYQDFGWDYADGASGTTGSFSTFK